MNILAKTTTASLAMILAACGTSDNPHGDDSLSQAPESSQSAEPPVAKPDPAVDATAASGKAETPNPYASGQPGQPAIPETTEDPNWQSRYSPDVPYYNRSDRAIPATMGASPRTALVGQVQPGDGGYIQTCEKNSSFCKITFGGNGKEGYVNIDLMSGEAR